MAASIITYGGIDVLEPIFTCISRLFKEHAYQQLFELFTLIAFLWVVSVCVYQQKILFSIRWFASFLFLYSILLIPKTTVGIEDRVNGQMAVVDNIPLGLALVASATSLIGDTLTQLMERHFSLPDDLKYSRNGMMMASRLVQASTRMTLYDEAFETSLKSFVSQCVFYDLLLGKYSLEALYDSPDVWKFVSQHASPARAFRYHGEIQVCQEGAQNLSHDWEQAVNRTSTLYGVKLFGGNEQEAKNKLMHLMPVSYHYLTNLSQGAANIMQQNLLANAIDDTVLQQGASVNSAAAVESYAVARAELMKRSTYRTMGQLAGFWLPVMKNVYEALTYASFILVALLMVLPIAFTALRYYVGTLLWLQSWAPLYAILNLIMNVYAQHQSSLMAHTLGHGASLSLYTQTGLFNANEDCMALAGYLTMSIPVLAYGIVKGGASVLTQLASQTANANQQSANKAAEEATTGNLGFGNTQFANHSAYNSSAYHLNTSPQFLTGQVSYNLADGAMIHHNPDGSDVIQSQTALSNTAINLQTGTALRDSINHQSERAHTAALNQMKAESIAWSSSLNSVHELAQSQGNLQALDDSTSNSDGASLSQGVQSIDQSIERFAHNNNLTVSQATKVLGEAMVSVEGHGGQGVRFGAKALANIQGISSADRAQLWQKAQEYIQTHNFSESAEATTRALHDQHVKTGNDSTQRVIDNISAKYDEAMHCREEGHAQLSRLESLRDLRQFSREDLINVSSNYNQKFSEWLMAQPGEHGQALGVTGAEQILNHEPERARDYANQFMTHKVDELIDNNLSHQYSHSDIQQRYQDDKSVFDGQRQVQDAYEYDKESVQEEEKRIDFQPFQPDSTVKEKSAELFKQVSQTVEANDFRGDSDVERLKGHAERRTNPKRHDTTILAVKEASRSVRSTLPWNWNKRD